MKSLAGRLGMISLLVCPAMLAAAAESGQQQGQVVRGEIRAVPAAPPVAATDAPPGPVFGAYTVTGDRPIAVLESSGVFQTVEPGAEATATDGADNKLEPRNIFSTRSGAEVEKEWQRIREQLADPEQRAKMLAQQRASLQAQYPEAEQVLHIDAATKGKLFDVLAEQNLRHMDETYSRMLSRGHPDTYAQAQAETQRLDALREVLGNEGLERFQNYTTTLGERYQVRSLTARLPPGSELQPDQEEQLIALLQEQNQRKFDAIRGSRQFMLPMMGGKLPSQEEMQRRSMLSTIVANEETLRTTQESNREMSRRAAAFLTPEQLKAFSQMNADNERQQRQWIASARAKAGLDPKASALEAADANAPTETRKPIEGDVQVEINLVVNRGAPTVVTQTVRNGEVVIIDTGEGLIVEATPTLYDDYWLDVKMAYYEQGRSGKRLLQNGGSFGTMTRMPDGLTGHRSRSESVVTGSKGYAVETSVSAIPL